MSEPDPARVYVLQEPFAQRDGDKIIVLWREVARATSAVALHCFIKAHGLDQFGRSGIRFALAEPDTPALTPLLAEPEPPRWPDRSDTHRWRQLELPFD